MQRLNEYIDEITEGKVILSGWGVRSVQRKGGASEGHYDSYYIPPPGFSKKKRYRSRAEVARALGLEIPAKRTLSARKKASTPGRTGCTGRPTISQAARKTLNKARRCVLDVVSPTFSLADKMEPSEITQWSTSGHKWIGSRIGRVFGPNKIVAQVVAWMPPINVGEGALWKVVHGDGDVEDLEREEIQSGMRRLGQWLKGLDLSGGVVPAVSWALRDDLVLRLDGTGVLRTESDSTANAVAFASPNWIRVAQSSKKKGKKSAPRITKASSVPTLASGVVTVTSLGRVETSRRYHDRRSIFPIGFRSHVKYGSMTPDFRYATLRCEILAGEDLQDEGGEIVGRYKTPSVAISMRGSGPVFSVSQVNPDGTCGVAIKANTLAGLWKQVDERVRAAGGGDDDDDEEEEEEEEEEDDDEDGEENDDEDEEEEEENTEEEEEENTEDIKKRGRLRIKLVLGKKNKSDSDGTPFDQTNKIEIDAAHPSSSSRAETATDGGTTATSKQEVCDGFVSRRVRLRLSGSTLPDRRDAFVSSKVFETSNVSGRLGASEYQGRALFGLMHPALLRLLPGMLHADKCREFGSAIKEETLRRSFQRAISSVALRLHRQSVVEDRERMRLERQLMRAEERLVRRLAKYRKRQALRQEMDRVRIPRGPFLEHIMSEKIGYDGETCIARGSTGAKHVSNVDDDNGGDIFSNEIMITAVPTVSQYEPMRKLMQDWNNPSSKLTALPCASATLMEVAEFLRHVGSESLPVAPLTIPKDSAIYVRKALRSLNVYALIAVLMEPESDSLNEESYSRLPFRTVVMWLLQSIYDDMNGLFPEKKMFCSKLLATLSWHEATVRYLTLLKYADTDQSSTLKAILCPEGGVDNTRYYESGWTSEESTAMKKKNYKRKLVVSNKPGSARKKARNKTLRLPSLCSDEPDPDTTLKREIFEEMAVSTRLQYMSACLRACVRTNTNVSGGTNRFRDLASSAVRAANSSSALPDAYSPGDALQLRKYGSIIAESVEGFKSNACGKTKRKLLEILKTLPSWISSSTPAFFYVRTPSRDLDCAPLAAAAAVTASTPSTTSVAAASTPKSKPKAFKVANMEFCSVCYGGGTGNILVCETPTCPNVCHIKCTGLDDAPTGDWFCKWCVTRREEEMPFLFPKQPRREGMLRVVEELNKHPYAGIFAEPVNLEVNPTYASIVSCPMDLGTIRKNIELSYYGEGEEDGVGRFVEDVVRVFTNCRLFNREGSGLHALGTVLLKYVVDVFGADTVPSSALASLRERPRAVAAILRTPVTLASSTPGQLNATIGDAHWRNGIITCENREHALAQSRVKTIDAFTIELDATSNLSPAGRLRLLKFLCDEACITVSVRSAMKRRRERQSKTLAETREVCRDVIERVKKEHPVGSIPSEVVKKLERFCHQHQRTIDDANFSNRIGCLGEDARGSRYYWHGPRDVCLFPNGSDFSKATLSFTETGHVLVETPPVVREKGGAAGDEEPAERRWFFADDYRTRRPALVALKPLVESLGKGNRIRCLLQEIASHSHSAHGERNSQCG
eukprot:g68.t1